MSNCCGKCMWYIPTRNPETSRVLTSQSGRCGYPVAWPTVLPIAYYWGMQTVSWPTPTRVWHSMGELCKCFEPKKKPKMASPQLPLEEERND